MESHLVESCSIFEVFLRNAKFPTFCGVSLYCNSITYSTSYLCHQLKVHFKGLCHCFLCHDECSCCDLNCRSLTISPQLGHQEMSNTHNTTASQRHTNITTHQYKFLKTTERCLNEEDCIFGSIIVIIVIIFPRAKSFHNPITL
jgi:hypothetical protein